jgi:hypothetical protein
LYLQVRRFQSGVFLAHSAAQLQRLALVLDRSFGWSYRSSSRATDLVTRGRAMAFESPTDQVRTLGDWIASRRDSGFVGRSAELSLFDRALRGELSPMIIYVHGPGGSGKTALLEAMRRLARELGYETIGALRS